MAKYLIAEQEMFGKVHFRVVRTDGDQRVGGYHQLDMDDLDIAESIVARDVRLNKLGPSEISIRRLKSKACEVRAVPSA